MRADKSKFKEQGRPDSLSGTVAGSLCERVNLWCLCSISASLRSAQEPFLLQPFVPGAAFVVRRSVACRHKAVRPHHTHTGLSPRPWLVRANARSAQQDIVWAG